MKVSIYVLFLLFTPLIIPAQDAWLSTPESINQFRERVESIKPVTSQFNQPLRYGWVYFLPLFI